MQQTSLRYYICHYISLIWKKNIEEFLFHKHSPNASWSKQRIWLYIYILFKEAISSSDFSTNIFTAFYSKNSKSVKKSMSARSFINTTLSKQLHQIILFYQFLTLIFMGFTLNFTKLTNWFDFHWLSLVAKQCLNLAYKFNLLCRKMSKDIANQIWPLLVHDK